MAVTISDILTFPCMRGAEVLGGRGGLNRTVSKVNVLEYSRPDETQAELLNAIEFVGSELTLTCFAGIKDDVDAQCVTMRMIADVGEVGVVVYYVGMVMREVSPRLVEIADSLDLPLICMPRNLRNLRYSEVISEVMEAIIKDQMTETRFQDEIMERLSALPLYQRSIGTALAMLSDRVKTSLLLTDEDGHLLNKAYWPRNIEPDTDALIALCRANRFDALEAQRIYARREQLAVASGARPELLMLKYDGAVEDSVAAQITDIAKVYVNLWSQSQEGHVLPELVQAILKDEPFKMRRIADTFKIDVKSMSAMLVASLAGKRPNTLEWGKMASTALPMIKDELSVYFKPVVADVYGNGIVVFLGASPGSCDMPAIVGALAESLEGAGISLRVTACLNLRDTAQVRKAYLMNQASAETAGYIYPDRKIFTKQDIEFADYCRNLMLQGEEAIKDHTSVLDALYDGPRLNTELCDTLTVYLLDAGSNLEDCARKMFLHLNTIKYRMKRIDERLKFKVGRMPETLSVYTAVALKRILKATGNAV